MSSETSDLIINEEGEWVNPNAEQITDGDDFHEIGMGSAKKVRAVVGTALGVRARQPYKTRRA
jgi:hypothetical protein